MRNWCFRLFPIIAMLLISCAVLNSFTARTAEVTQVPKAPVTIQLISSHLVLAYWEPSVSPDVAIYKIYVNTEPDNGGDWQLAGFATHKVGEDSIGAFVNWDLPLFARTEWIVTATDTAGNESEPSNVVEFIRTK